MDTKLLNKIALKSGIWYTFSSVLLKAVSIITAPIFTRLLSTEDYGITSIFIAWSNIIMIFTGLCLTYSFGRAKIDYSYQFDEYISSIQTLGSLVAVAFFMISILFSDFLASIMGIDRILVVIMFLYLIFAPSVEYVLSKYRYEYRYKENIGITIINTIGAVLFSITFIFLFPKQPYYGRIIGTLLPMFILGIVFYFKILKEGHILFKKEYWKYALKISLPMIPHALAMVVLVQIDRIMIMYFCGSSYAGIYSFAYSYAILLAIFTNAIGQAWLPWFNEKFHNGQFDSIKSANKSLNYLACLLTLGFIVIAPEVLKLLGPEAYWDGKWVVSSIAIGTLYQYFYSNYVGIELYLKKTPLISIGSIMAAILNVVLNWLFIPQFGYIAAGYTTLVGYFCLFLFHLFGSKIIFKKQVFDDRNTFILIIITSIIGFVITFFYNDIILRYIVSLIIFSLIISLKKQEIFSTFKKLKDKKFD